MVIAGVVLAGPAGPAQAACQSTIGLPARIVVTREYQEVKVPLHTSCADMSYAAADLYGLAGYDSSFEWDPAHNGAIAYLDVYGGAFFAMATGPHHTRDAIAYDDDGDRLPISNATTTVKLGSKVGLIITRTKKSANIRFSTWRYFTRYQATRLAGSEQVSVSFLKNGKWQWISSPTSGSDGVGNLRVSTIYTHTYRVCTRANSFVWSGCTVHRA
jgi:hypothetical protein